MNNLKKQVSNCELNDFVPDAILWGEIALTMKEIYQMNNLKQQVSTCVLNDFVPDSIPYNIFRSVDVLPEGDLGCMRNGLLNRTML